MGVLDWILLVIRWAHALAAVAWVGGGAFYLLVLRPALRRVRGTPPEAAASIAAEFRGLVGTAIIVLLLTGALLTLARLTESSITALYVAVLAAKIALATLMFALAWTRRRAAGRDDAAETDAAETPLRRWRRRLTGDVALLTAGVVVIGLSDVLTALFEQSLRG